jgi:hypothetical protein
MWPTNLPQDLPSFLKRFGTDEQCPAYLFQAPLVDYCGHSLVAPLLHGAAAAAWKPAEILAQRGAARAP